MNNDPGEMPNPLNPTPGRTPGSNNSTLDANPPEQPTEESAMIDAIQSVGVSTTGADPMARPMEQAPSLAPNPPKKKKTGLIIGIIIGAVVLICGVVVAVLLVMNLTKGDAVSRAMSKLINGEAPQNVIINGTIDITPNNADSPFTSVQIDLNSEAATSSMINHSNAKITFSLDEVDDVSVDFEEVYAANGDLYFKLDGSTAAIEDLTASLQNKLLEEPEVVDTTNCDTDETGATNCIEAEEESEGELILPTQSDSSDLQTSMSSFAGILEVVDGEWLKVSMDELNEITSGTENSEMSCLVNLAKDTKEHNNSVAKIYNDNPFIESTTENLSVTSKNNPIYKITINEKNFTNYMNELQGSTELNDLFSCMGYENSEVNMDNVAEEISNLPDIYVEIDDEDNFTRLYFVSEMNTDDNNATITTDLNFTYPDTINVAEPTEYKDFSSVIQEIFTSMYTLPTSDDIDVDESYSEEELPVE